MIDRESEVFESRVGDSPLVISLPHVGTAIPPMIASRMTEQARRVEDTDWHVERLYAFAREAGASWLQARLSRYVIDLNRPPGDEALYPGQLSTGLCPVDSFAGAALYAGAAAGAPLDDAEVAARREQYWAPYHAALARLIAAARQRHGYAVLLDAHSIRSVVPRLFEGRLPEVNLGTNGGRSCDLRLSAALAARLGAQQRFSWVRDGRFKGGYITRAYGQPQAAVHALQIELVQEAYMDEAGTAYSEQRAQPLQSLLRELVALLSGFDP